MNQSFTDYLKNEFINGSMVKKDNFEELWEVWREELDDDELNKFANEWKKQELINVFEAVKKVEISAGIKELNKIN